MVIRGGYNFPIGQNGKVKYNVLKSLQATFYTISRHKTNDKSINCPIYCSNSATKVYLLAYCVPNYGDPK